MIVSSCWQSGLDYSEHATVFASLFAKGSYQLALECFTVLEESMNNLDRDVRDEIIKILRKGKESYSYEKISLMHDLTSMLG